MPRKPTLHALHARAQLLEMVAEQSSGDCLPTLEILGKEFRLHPSTIFRILRDLCAEGVVWQSPNGRFYSAAARSKHVRGLPIYFIGREMWHWSRLYHEILEGVSEVCSANASPLVLLSSRSLVHQQAPSTAPEFASPRTQAGDLSRLAGSLPRGIAGIIFDHVWCERALGKVRWPGGQKIQLLHGTGKYALVIAPDYSGGAASVADYIRQKKIQNITLVIPFEGDPAIDAATLALREALAPFSPIEIPYSQLDTFPGRFEKIARASDLILCPEDNIAGALAERLRAVHGPHKPVLFGTQGTGVLHAPSIRLRIDFRRLGRAAASQILHSHAWTSPRPTLIQGTL